MEGEFRVSLLPLPAISDIGNSTTEKQTAEEMDQQRFPNWTVWGEG